MISAIQDVLTDPDGFFENRDSEPELLPPVIIVSTYIVFTITANLPVVIVMLDERLERVLTIGLASLAVGQAVTIFGVWLILAVAFQALSYLFGGTGSFRRMFTLIGWGFLPLIAGAVLLTIATLIMVQDAPSMAVQSPEQVATAVDQIRSGPVSVVTRLISILLFGWSSYILTFALKHTRGISTRQALPIVVVTVPVVFAFTVFPW